MVFFGTDLGDVAAFGEDAQGHGADAPPYPARAAWRAPSRKITPMVKSTRLMANPVGVTSPVMRAAPIRPQKVPC